MKIDYLGRLLRLEWYRLPQLIMMGKIMGNATCWKEEKIVAIKCYVKLSIASVERLFRLATEEFWESAG